jgi:hypothetical protein
VVVDVVDVDVDVVDVVEVDVVVVVLVQLTAVLFVVDAPLLSLNITYHVPLNTPVKLYVLAPLNAIGVADNAEPADVPIATLVYVPLPPLNPLTIILPVPLIPLPSHEGVSVKLTGGIVVDVVVVSPIK